MLRLNELLSKRISYDFFAELAVPKAATGGVLWKKNVLKNFANFTGEHLCWISL